MILTYKTVKIEFDTTSLYLFVNSIFVSPPPFCLIILTNPRGPILGAREEVAPTSPPTTLRYTKHRLTYQH